MYKEKFLEWYFFSGSDQEQKEMLIFLGRQAMESLFDSGQYKVNVNDLFSVCGHIYLDELESKKQNQST